MTLSKREVHKSRKFTILNPWRSQLVQEDLAPIAVHFLHIVWNPTLFVNFQTIVTRNWASFYFIRGMVSGFLLTNSVVFLTENGNFFVEIFFSSINLTIFSIFWIHHPIFSISRNWKTKCSSKVLNPK